MKLLHPNAHCCVPALLLVSLLGVASPTSATEAVQRRELAAALRQVDALERFVAHSAASGRSDQGERYHFDYARLHRDIERIRAGIQDYLVPQRAQPRDPIPLTGDYVRRDDRDESSP